VTENDSFGAISTAFDPTPMRGSWGSFQAADASSVRTGESHTSLRLKYRVFTAPVTHSLPDRELSIHPWGTHAKGMQRKDCHKAQGSVLETLVSSVRLVRADVPRVM
jgi:hypothetical protein